MSGAANFAAGTPLLPKQFLFAVSRPSSWTTVLKLSKLTAKHNGLQKITDWQNLHKRDTLHHSLNKSSDDLLDKPEYGHKMQLPSQCHITCSLLAVLVYDMRHFFRQLCQHLGAQLSKNTFHGTASVVTLSANVDICDDTWNAKHTEIFNGNFCYNNANIFFSIFQFHITQTNNHHLKTSFHPLSHNSYLDV